MNNPRTNGEYDCFTCNGYISWEHGGVVCNNCDAFYCCDTRCTGSFYDGSGQSVGIDKCRLCSDPAKESDEVIKV